MSNKSHGAVLLSWGLLLASLLLSSMLIREVRASAPVTGTAEDADSVRYPIDLYFLADRSGSMSPTSWKEVQGFINQLQSRMATLAGGYYQNSSAEGDGLRVSVAAFGCLGSQSNVNSRPLMKEFISGPTGNQTLIQNGLKNLLKQKSMRGTCPSGGLQRFLDELNTNRQNNSARPSAVVLLTDGGIWSNDFKKCNNTAATIRSLDDVYMFGINYGSNPAGTKDMQQLVANKSRIFASNDLNQVANLLSVIMLGHLSVQFVPTPDEIARVQNYTTNKNKNITTVCLGESSVPLELIGRAVNLFGASQILCAFTRLETNETFTVNAVSRNNQIFCDVPGSLARKPLGNGTFSQNFRLEVDSRKNGQRTSLFTVNLVSLNVVVCLTVDFVGTSSGGDNCFPSENPRNSSYGVLQIQGTTVSNATSNFYCVFDSSNRVLATRDQFGTLQCTVPAVDIQSALNSGTDPTPFSQFNVQDDQNRVLLNSAIDKTDFTPVSCVATLDDTKNDTFCWNSGDVGTQASFQGKSLTNLVTNFASLEFSCVYQYNRSSVTVGAVLGGGDIVQCGQPPLKDFFAGAYPLNDDIRYLNVSIQVRAKQGAANRGWWSMKTDPAFPVKVSSCLDVSLSSYSALCLGDSLTLSFNGSGVDNFFMARSTKCNFLTASGTLLQSNTVEQGQSCTYDQISTRVARVEVRDAGAGSNAALWKVINLPGNPFVSPCFDFAQPDVNTSDVTFCWGSDLGGEAIEVTGRSVDFYQSRALPMCKFSLIGFASGTSSSSAVRKGNDTLVCKFPSAWGFRRLPFTANYSLSIVDSTEDFTVADTRGVQTLELQSCVKRTPLPLDPQDQNKLLPSCAPDCCLRRQAQVRFQGTSADDVVVCSWVAANGTVIGTTDPQDAQGGGKLCVVPDWVPPSPTDVFPAVTVKAYSDFNESFVLGEATLDNRTACVYSDFATKQVTFGTDLQVTFGGPTVRDVLNLFSFKCALMSSSSASGLRRLVTAKVDANGFTCVLDKMYDSLVGMSLGLYLFPLESEGATNSPTPNPSHQAVAGRRRLRSLQNNGSNNASDPLAGGVELYTQTLTDVDVSAQMVSAVSPDYCVDRAVNLTFNGPGAPVLQNQVTCVFVLNENTTQTMPAVFNNVTNELSCSIEGFAPNSVNVTYNASIVREDNNQTMVLLSGSRLSCAVAPPPVTTPPSAGPVPSSEPLSAGAIVGIVIGCLALLLLIVGAAIYDKHRKDEEKRKRREAAAEAAAAAGAAAAAAAKDAKGDPEAGDGDMHKAVPEVIAIDAVSDASAKSSPSASGRPVTNDEDPVILVVSPPSPPAPKDMVTTSATPRKFGVGDCVQVLDSIDDSWRYTFVRGFAPGNNEYYLEDERLPVPESRIRWPTYSPGEAVEARKTAEGDWLPGVVAFVDPDLGTVRLMGGSGEDYAFANVRPAPFQIGENVEERGPDQEWRPAVVVSCEPDGTYVVDGAGGLGLNRTRKRLRWPQYKGGDIVEVRNAETGEWNRATVVTTEGGIVVGLEDGKVDPKRFPNMDVRRPLVNSKANVSALDMSVVSAGANTPGGADESDSPRRKFKRREPIDFHELPDFCFEITIDKSQGMGVRFGWTRDQQVVVQKFLGVPGMDAGPLEASECVSLGDQLLAVNGVSVGGRSFAEVTDMIRTAPDRVTLKFGRWRETVKMKIAPAQPNFTSPASGRKSMTTSDSAKKTDMSLV